MQSSKNGQPLKVVILCGGKGSRLREEAEFRHKPLVTIGGMPILWHVMKIYSHYGLKDFVLCLGHKGEMIKDYFLNLKEMTSNFTLNLCSASKYIDYHNEKPLEDWRITFVDTGAEAQTGARVYRIRDFVKDSQEFFLTYSDGVADIDIGKLLSCHREKNKILTVSGVHTNSVFGLIEHKDGLVKKFQEKPIMQDVVSGGFFVCKNNIFNYLEDNDRCIFEDAPMKRLAEENQLGLYEHKGFWSCMDTQKHVDELNSVWQSGEVPWRERRRLDPRPRAQITLVFK